MVCDSRSPGDTMGPRVSGLMPNWVFSRVGWLFWWNPGLVSGLVYFPGSSVFIRSHSVWRHFRGNLFSHSLIPQTTKIARKGRCKIFPRPVYLSLPIVSQRASNSVCMCVRAHVCHPNFQLSEVCTLVCSGHSDVLMFWPLFSSVWWQLYCTVSVDPSCLKHT